MDVFAALLPRSHNLRSLVCVSILWLSTGILPADEILYHLTFDGSDTGTYQVLSGNPSIEISPNSLDPVLAFHASASGDQIRLPIEVAGSRYELQYDIVAHDLLGSDYAFVLLLDTTPVEGLSFHGGLDSIYVYQSDPFINQTLMSFSNDTVYHVGVTVDFDAGAWSVAIDGTPACSNPLNGTSFQDVRFGLAPWIAGAADAPDIYVGLDNVVLGIVPEPSAWALVLAGFPIWRSRFGARFRR